MHYIKGVIQQHRWVVLCLLSLVTLGLPVQSAACITPVNDTFPTRQKPVIAVTGSYYFGKFIRHSPKLTTRTGQFVPGGEIGFHLQTLGKQSWQAARHFPGMGAALLWFQPGAGAHGNLFGFLPYLSLPVKRFQHGGVYFRLGSGVGWASRPYDAFSNPGENALGTHWNNVTQFRLGGDWQKGRWRLAYGAMLTHFSNGGYALPNYGMNIPGGYLGVAYTHDDRSVVFPAGKADKKPGRRWGATIQSGLARIEYVNFDGPKYAVWLASGAVTWKINRFNRLAMGMDWEKNNGVKAWLINNTVLAGGRSAAAKGAQRQGVFLAEELFYGNLSIYLQVSYHIGKEPLNSLALSRNYNKLGLRYYFKPVSDRPPALFLGLSLKAYKGVAEHIALHAGMDF